MTDFYQYPVNAFSEAAEGGSELQAAQLSARGGRLGCRVAGDRVVLSGAARRFAPQPLPIALTHAAA